jgi:hypothetical protein
MKKFQKCHSAQDVAAVQRQALIDTIKEAEHNETMRRKLLAKAPSEKRVNQLKSRYEQERARDQERIAHLMADLESVSAAASAGAINMQSRQSGPPPKIPGCDKDRFAGSQYHSNLKDQYNKSMAQARYAEWKNRDRYDEYGEKRRLVLLEKKRDILAKLVTVQRNALTESHLAKQSGWEPNRRAHSARAWSDTSSVVSSRTSRSEASYATFCPPAPKPTVPSRLSKINLPKLTI